MINLSFMNYSTFSTLIYDLRYNKKKTALESDTKKLYTVYIRIIGSLNLMCFHSFK